MVWFGETLPEGALETAAEAVHAAELLIVAGTSGAVWPAAGLVELACRHRIPVIAIDPSPEIWEGRALVLRGRAGELLPALVA